LKHYRSEIDSLERVVKLYLKILKRLEVNRYFSEIDGKIEILAKSKKGNQ
jgi:hypothetical protein